MEWRKLSDMPVLMKKLRLQEHIKWAAENETLDAAYKASSRDITIIRCPSFLNSPADLWGSAVLHTSR
ncbi:MAG: hypothetical protein U9R02_12000 [Thermodesulfobacteriota bacterium]|nr:hypothetical protein [Thermodesulfobacteriota bacterium]